MSKINFIFFDLNVLISKVHGIWGDWTEDVTCNAKCESQGVLGEIRTCSAPEHGGDECTRADQTATNPYNRVELRETSCENTAACTSKENNRLKKQLFILAV